MIYAICNQKGGVGKSTTAGAIVSGAFMRGKNSLAIDLDGQGNLSFSMGADTSRPGSFELITHAAKLGDVIQHTEQGDVIPAGPELATADTILNGAARTDGLKRAIRGIKSQYDIVAIDCPPGLGTLLLNALTAADSVIIPTGATVYALQGLTMLVQTIRETQKEYNAHLNIKGLLFTMYNGRANATRTYTQIIIEQAKAWHVPVFATRIRRGIAVEEAAIFRESLFTHAPKAKVTQDYNSFLDELGL